MRVLLALLASLICTGCDTRDCAEERAGQVRCLSNQVERCNADGSLTYEPCSPRGLFCSVKHQGCVTQDVLEGAGGSQAGAGGESVGQGDGGQAGS